MSKRFPSWQPIAGDRAIVPSGPANAGYVDTLTARDVEAINSGHRGYAPLDINISFVVKGYVEPFDTLRYIERNDYWQSSYGGHVKRLDRALFLARQQMRGCKMVLDAVDVQRQAIRRKTQA